ncbi:hypothetical protein MMC11_008467, partial [Xylographa trunciseda]|nr:hypothetical protein [Xylographa trunciseda]
MAIAEEMNIAPDSQTAYETRLAAMKATLKQLGIEVKHKIIVKLADNYNDVMPMARYLAENGYWTPLALAGDGEDGD